MKRQETLPQSVLYSKNDPWFAFLNKEYAFLTSQIIHLIWWTARQTLGTQAGMREGNKMPFARQHRLSPLSEKVAAAWEQTHLQTLILALMKTCTSRKHIYFRQSNSGCQAGEALKEKVVRMCKHQPPVKSQRHLLIPLQHERSKNTTFWITAN